MSSKNVKKSAKKTGSAANTGQPVLKRPMTAFFFYLNDRRPKLLEEQPHLKKAAKEIAKIVGEEWRAMTAEQKKEFSEKAADAKAVYDKHKAEATTKAEVAKKAEQAEEEDDTSKQDHASSKSESDGV